MLLRQNNLEHVYEEEKDEIKIFNLSKISLRKTTRPSRDLPSQS